MIAKQNLGQVYVIRSVHIPISAKRRKHRTFMLPCSLPEEAVACRLGLRTPNEHSLGSSARQCENNSQTRMGLQCVQRVCG